MWLLKTEPTDYSYDQLEQDGRTRWDGVSNPAALKNIRAMKPGDRAFLYHTGKEKAVVGVVEIVTAAYPDPEAKGPKLVAVDIEPRARLGRPVTLAEIKALPAFEGSPLVRQGRLSVVPLTSDQWKTIEEWSRA
ncbi:MAG: EVE domain-containing protein [Acidobacteria bacterium]|jgi:predicted RNA-binding protein with PUA-like domain|nr:EVE domain-containing protein [Acidobacteriota bacterium]